MSAPPGQDDASSKTALHLAPHPDDEIIGAPATLMTLRDAGWRIVNLAVSLGAPRDKERREKELRLSCERARFELRIADLPLRGPLTGPPGPLTDEESTTTERAITTAVTTAIEDEQPALVVAPSPQDVHPGHEIVGRAAVSALEAVDARGAPGQCAPALWLWGLWADLPFPTIAVEFGAERMNEILQSLEAHAGELERNDYRLMLKGRALMNASLGPERVFGFGVKGRAKPDTSVSGYVEILSEVRRSGGEWVLGTPRWLDADDPLGSRTPPTDSQTRERKIGEWLHAQSPPARYGLPGR